MLALRLLSQRLPSIELSIWHVHGEADQPSSMLLGYEHYAAYLQVLNNNE